MKSRYTQYKYKMYEYSVILAREQNSFQQYTAFVRYDKWRATSKYLE
jgi:hypothetical protein